jgi:hypothetical protein
MSSPTGASHPDMGHLVLDVSGPAVRRGHRHDPMTSPAGVSINGQAPIRVDSGQTWFALQPGQHNLVVGLLRHHTGIADWPRGTYAFHYGAAAIIATVLPGQTTAVYYRAPAAMGVPGAIGLTPQTTPGRGVLVLWLAVIAGMILFGVLMAL